MSYYHYLNKLQSNGVAVAAVSLMKHSISWKMAVVERFAISWQIELYKESSEKKQGQTVLNYTEQL